MLGKSAESRNCTDIYFLWKSCHSRLCCISFKLCRTQLRQRELREERWSSLWRSLQSVTSAIKPWSMSEMSRKIRLEIRLTGTSSLNTAARFGRVSRPTKVDLYKNSSRHKNFCRKKDLFPFATTIVLWWTDKPTIEAQKNVWALCEKSTKMPQCTTSTTQNILRFYQITKMKKSEMHS